MESIVLMVGMMSAFIAGAWVGRGMPGSHRRHTAPPVVLPEKDAPNPVADMMAELEEMERRASAERAKQVFEALNWNGTDKKEAITDE